MKKFETPEVEVINFAVEDIITTSTTDETTIPTTPNMMCWG